MELSALRRLWVRYIYQQALYLYMMEGEIKGNRKQRPCSSAMKNKVDKTPAMFLASNTILSKMVFGLTVSLAVHSGVRSSSKTHSL